jgi:hypothetical protein
MNSHYYEGFVRARRTMADLSVDHGLVDEVMMRNSVRFRVGHSLVSLGQHLMGVANPNGGSDLRRAA